VQLTFDGWSVVHSATNGIRWEMLVPCVLRAPTTWMDQHGTPNHSRAARVLIQMASATSVLVWDLSAREGLLCIQR